MLSFAVQLGLKVVSFLYWEKGQFDERLSSAPNRRADAQTRNKTISKLFQLTPAVASFPIHLQ